MSATKIRVGCCAFVSLIKHVKLLRSFASKKIKFLKLFLKAPLHRILWIWQQLLCGWLWQLLLRFRLL